MQSEPPKFDPASRAWILTRHADVLAALREPRLEPEGGSSKSSGRRPRLRQEVLAALPSLKRDSRREHDAWRAEIEALAHQLLRDLSPSRLDSRVDFVADVLRPWALEIAIRALPYRPLQGARLRRLARTRRRASILAKLANAQFDFYFRNHAGQKSVFIGISETLPAFLANAWAALLSHPAELQRLRAEPDSIPAAVDELLRYAGIVHTLVRTAAADLDFAGVRISAGSRVMLKLAAANRDPEVFAAPQRLDLHRPASLHLALGHGGHACAGAMLVRPAFDALLRALQQRFAAIRLDGPIEWQRGETLVSASALPVRLISH